MKNIEFAAKIREMFKDEIGELNGGDIVKINVISIRKELAVDAAKEKGLNYNEISDSELGDNQFWDSLIEKADLIAQRRLKDQCINFIDSQYSTLIRFNLIEDKDPDFACKLAIEIAEAILENSKNAY